MGSGNAPPSEGTATGNPCVAAAATSRAGCAAAGSAVAGAASALPPLADAGAGTAVAAAAAATVAAVVAAGEAAGVCVVADTAAAFVEEACARAQQLDTRVSLPEAVKLHGGAVGHIETHRVVRGGGPLHQPCRAYATELYNG
eukprot:scaffold34002_cov65-Phaeocystis_antarctica.AAC.3